VANAIIKSKQGFPILLFDSPWLTIAWLQRLQNAAVRLVMGLPGLAHVFDTPVRLIHSLPGMYTYRFRLALQMYVVFTTSALDISATFLSFTGRLLLGG